MEPFQLHDRPVKDGAREVALRLTQRAAEACLRLHDAEDVEALHDFRVGVRRLRTFLRAYANPLDMSKKALTGLKRLARSTNETRDLEVGTRWLEAQRDSLTSRERVGLNWFVDRLREQEDAAYRRVRGSIPRGWARMETRLRRRLSFACTAGPTPGTFGQVSADLLVTGSGRLERRLEQIGSVADVDPAHDARICAKRLRYLIEPFRTVVPEARPAVRELRRFQDLFGDLNDAHVMLPRLREAARLAGAERAARLFEVGLRGDADAAELRSVRRRTELPGLLRLAGLAHTKREEHFARIGERYLGGAASDLLDAVRRVAEALSADAPGPLRLIRSQPASGSEPR